MKKIVKVFCLLILVAFLSAPHSVSQPGMTDIYEKIEQVSQSFEYLGHRLDVLEKKIDDIYWYNKVGDIAHIDKVYMTGPPLRNEPNPTAQGAGNPVKFWSYVFIPRSASNGKKYPLLVFPHGGVHSDFNTYYTHIMRELLSQGYIIVAAEYRGSTGYGASHYRKIDYGGLETEDVDASRQYMIDNYDIVDKNRIGILGWSHGGLITLHNIFDHPDNYHVAFAGVPVSDLIARMGYKTQGYRDLYSADYHIGKTAYADVEEYRRRSPAWQADKYENKPPLLIHTNTNDADVNVLEVEHLIKALKAEGKKNFEYEIFKDIPGGHSFDRMDHMTAKNIRMKIYKHLNSVLKPENPFNSIKDLKNAGYGYE